MMTFAILHLQTAVVMELVKYVKLLLKQEETVIEIKRKITYNS
jgi:hypothetical protein